MAYILTCVNNNSPKAPREMRLKECYSVRGGETIHPLSNTTYPIQGHRGLEPIPADPVQVASSLHNI